MKRFATKIAGTLALLLFLVLVGGIVIIWQKWGIGLEHYRDLVGMPEDVLQRGVWGDSFGAFNALFAALGFTVIAATLVMQIRQNRNIAIDQHKQRFETSFFELLYLFRESRASLNFRYSKEYVRDHSNPDEQVKSGSIALRYACREVIYWIDQGGGGRL